MASYAEEEGGKEPEDLQQANQATETLVKPPQPKISVDSCIDLYVDSPCKCFWSCCFFQFVFVVVSIASQSMTIETRDGGWRVISQDHTKFHTAYVNAKRVTDAVPSGRLLQHWNTTAKSFSDSLHSHAFLDVSPRKAYDFSRWMQHRSNTGRRLQEGTGGSNQFYFFYKTNTKGTGNIFNAASFQSMCELEKTAMLGHGGVFERIQSPVVWAYGFNSQLQNPENWQCILLPDATVNSFVQKLWADVKEHKTQSQFARFVQPSFAETGTSAFTRSSIVARGADQDKWEETVFSKLGTSYGFLRSAYQGDDSDCFLKYDSLRVRFWYDGTEEFDKMIGPDFIMAFVSVVLVYITMYAYLRSFWLASWAMYQIVFSLPIGAFFYRHVFRIDYFEFLHVLIVYLVLGIGADDVFVFVDSFKHISEEFGVAPGCAYSRDVLHAVLRKSCTRAAGAIFNTSFTTSIAFLSCSISKVMPMRTCGWFAACCIVTVFILTVTFIPSVLVIYHRYFQGTRCCCPPCRRRPQMEGALEVSATQERKLDFMQNLVEKYYIPFMSKKVGPVRAGALAICIVMLGVAAQGISFAAQLTPPSKAEVWFPSTHMLTEFGEFISSTYYSPDYDDYAVITVFWGIKDLNLDDYDVYYPDKFKGGVVYDTHFDLSTKEAQDSLLYVCDQLQTVACNLEGCTNAGYGTLMMQTTYPTINCFLADMKTELGTLPQGPAFFTALQQFRSRENADKYNSRALSSHYKETIGIIGGELKYVAVQIRSTIRNEEVFGKGTDVRDLVKKYVGEWKAASPQSMHSIKYEADSLFAQYDLGAELINGFFSGIAIAAPASFLVLLVSTRNIIISLYAVAAVAFIVCCVLGFCKSAMDWDLGTGEAIAGVIVIGYSVDFCVHLAHMYHEANTYGLTDRDERCKFAMRNLGTTIFAGALTTSGAGVPMFICFFYFFFKMATLITVTIMYSLLFSIGFFMSLLWLIGPNGDVGEIPTSCLKRNKVAPEAASSEVEAGAAANAQAGGFTDIGS